MEGEKSEKVKKVLFGLGSARIGVLHTPIKQRKSKAFTVLHIREMYYICYTLDFLQFLRYNDSVKPLKGVLNCDLYVNA